MGSIISIASAQITKGKKIISNDFYAIHFDKKSKEIFIYDNNKTLLNSYRCKDIPKLKNRMKYIQWMNPEDTYIESSRSGFSNLYETKSHLIISFNTDIGQLSALQVLFFHKATKVFELKRLIFPNVLGSKSNNSYILGDQLYTLQINMNSIIAQIRSLDNPEEVLKEFKYYIDQPLNPANTPISKSVDAAFLIGRTQTSKTYSEKEQKKALRKLINKGSKYGAKIKATPLSEDLLEITLGTHYIIASGNPDLVTEPNEKMWYFKLVIDSSNNFEHVTNEILEGMEISLKTEEFESSWN